MSTVNTDRDVAARIAHAHKVEAILELLGWLAAVLGLLGICTFIAMWAVGDLDAEQAVSLILGAVLGSVRSRRPALPIRWS